MDYIYVADADEVLDEENRRKFKLLKEAMLPEIDIVQMYYRNQLSNGTVYNYDKEYRPKLYKRLRQFQWIEPVHEMVQLDPVIYDSEIEIDHMPLSNHSSRDFGLFVNYFRKNKRLSKRLHHMYTMELYISYQDESFLEAIDICEATMNDPTRSMDELKEAMVILEHAYRIKGDDYNFLKVIAKDTASSPSAETCCELGEYYYEKEDYNEACIWYLNAMEEAESILSINASGEFPCSRLIECYSKLGVVELEEHYRKEMEKYD